MIEPAEDLAPTLLDPLYAAEAAKIEACGPVIDAIGQKIDAHHATFMEQFWFDLQRLFVRLVPVGSVERCAQAQKAYAEEFIALCRRLASRSVDEKCPE